LQKERKMGTYNKLVLYLEVYNYVTLDFQRHLFSRYDRGPVN